MDSEERKAVSPGSIVFTTLLWLLAGYIFLGGFGFGYPANLAPLILGGTASALLTGLLVWELSQLVRGGGHRADAASTGPAGHESTDATTHETTTGATAHHPVSAHVPPGAVADSTTTRTTTGERAGGANEAIALAWVGGSIVLLILLGFLVGMSLAVAGLVRVYGRESWRTTVVTTAGVMLTLYLAFGVVLGVAFYPGALGLWG